MQNTQTLRLGSDVFLICRQSLLFLLDCLGILALVKVDSAYREIRRGGVPVGGSGGDESSDQSLFIPFQCLGILVLILRFKI